MLSIGDSYQIASNEQLGRYMVAAKDLEMGDIIFQEAPLIHAPEKGTKLICPGCYKVTDNAHQCGKCGWPICSPNCKKLSNHSTECNLVQIIFKRNNCKSNLDWQSLSDGLMLLRCLSLKTENSEKWEVLLNMETNWEQWTKSPLYAQAEKMLKIIRESYEISPEAYSTNEILRIQAALDINAYEIRLSEANIQASYALASIVEHNCVPNTHRTISGGSLILTLRASTKIEKGTNLSTSYCDMLWPTLQRQNFLKWSKFFVCHCLRCEDPTEMGSYLSSMLCPDCPDENPLTPILSDRDLEVEDSSFAKYNCPSCKETFDGEYVKKHLELAETELEELDKDATPEKYPLYEEWILKWSVMPQLAREKTISGEQPELGRPLILHPHHCLVLDACHTAFLIYAAEETSSIDELLKKECLGTHLINATKSIVKGISTFQGTVKYELAMAKVGLLLRFLEEPQNPGFTLKLKQLAQESVSLLQDSLNLLQYEPIETPEGLLVKNGTVQLTQLKSFIQETVPNIIV